MPYADVRPLLAILEGVPLPGASSVLVIARRAEPVEAALTAAGHRVLTLPAAPDTGEELGPFDLAVVLVPLEGDPWDRWTLQKVHRWVRPGGHLLFAAPNTFAPASLADPRYVTAKAAKQWNKLRARLGARVPPPPAHRERSYTLAQFRDMLESLGFRVERVRGLGLLGGASASPLASHHVALASRVPSLFGSGPGRPYPEPGAHRRAFEAEYASFLRIRDEWIARAAPGSIAPPTALDPVTYRDRDILVLAPHPDDEVIGCGGTLLELMHAGARVTVIQATDGRAAAALEGAPDHVRRQVRLDEAASVASAAGFQRTLYWNADNDRFAPTPGLVASLRQTMAELRPALVFTPFVTDIHPDHVTLDRMLAESLAGDPAPGTDVLCYEVWGLVATNCYCDVTRQMPRIEELMMRYVTAMKAEDYLRFCAERNYYNACVWTGRPGFVEAFHRVPADRFPALLATVGNASAGPRREDVPPRPGPATLPT